MDPSKKVTVSIVRYRISYSEVVDLKQEVPDMRSGGIPPI